jgi:hypothetical protein
VDVIRHHDERDEVVHGADSVALPNGLGNAFGDSRLFEPGRARRRALEFSVGCSESASVAAGSQRESAVQSKRNEQGCSVGLKVREVATVFQVIQVVRTVEVSQSLHRLKPVPP